MTDTLLLIAIALLFVGQIFWLRIWYRQVEINRKANEWLKLLSGEIQRVTEQAKTLTDEVGKIKKGKYGEN